MDTNTDEDDFVEEVGENIDSGDKDETTKEWDFNNFQNF
jgi:hypothetical protein